MRWLALFFILVSMPLAYSLSDDYIGSWLYLREGMLNISINDSDFPVTGLKIEIDELSSKRSGLKINAFYDPTFELFERQSDELIHSIIDMQATGSLPNISKKKHIFFRINSSWLKDKNITDMALYRKDYRWFRLPLLFESQDTSHNYYNVTLPEFQYLVLVGVRAGDPVNTSDNKNNDTSDSISKSNTYQNETVINASLEIRQQDENRPLQNPETSNGKKAANAKGQAVLQQADNMPKESIWPAIVTFLGVLLTFAVIFLTLYLNRKLIFDMLHIKKIEDKEAVDNPKEKAQEILGKNIEEDIAEMAKHIEEKDVEKSEITYDKLKVLYVLLEKNEKSKYFAAIHDMYNKLIELKKETKEEKKDENHEAGEQNGSAE